MMKAIRFDRYGEPAKVLTVQESPPPEPRKGEVRVRILASPVNPSDLLFVRGLEDNAGVQPHFPSPVGFEGVGIVDALGPQVDGPVPGQRVVVINWNGGNWAEYAVVPVRDALPVPDDLPDEKVASFFINPATAILMLRHVLAIQQGEWLLQSAASSELGRMIIRLAKHDGIRTVNVVRRHEAVAELKQLGADVVIVSSDVPIDEQVRRIVGPKGVKYAIDPVVGETGTQMFQALGDEGRMLVYGSLTGEPIRVGADPRFILVGHRILEVYFSPYWFARLDDTALRRLFQEIVNLIHEGILVTSAARPFSLDEIGTAVTQAEATGRKGKILLVPQKH
jgi:NADPH:quinone reductase